MARKRKEYTKLIRHNAIEIFVKLAGSGFLTGVLIAAVVMLLQSYAEKVKTGMFFDAYTFFLTLIFLAFSGIGVFFFVWGIKDIYDWIIYVITKKKGIETVGKIIDCKKVSKGGHTNNHGTYYPGIIHYSIIFEYEQDGEKKVAKTDYLYLEVEYNYLITLPQVKIIVHKANAIVNERFRRELYRG